MMGTSRLRLSTLIPSGRFSTAAPTRKRSSALKVPRHRENTPRPGRVMARASRQYHDRVVNTSPLAALAT
jgi:hypothetical protein